MDKTIPQDIKCTLPVNVGRSKTTSSPGLFPIFEGKALGTRLAQKGLYLSSVLAVYNNRSYLLVPQVPEDPLLRPFLEEKRTFEGLFSVEISMAIIS